MAVGVIGVLADSVGGGATRLRVSAGTASVTGTGAIATGLSKILAATADVVNAATTIPTRVATISAIGASTVSAVVVILDVAANGSSIAGTASTVQVIAIGY
jgi:hypothetical protein